MNLIDLMEECQHAFQKKQNILMDRHKFFNRNGLAPNFGFGSQTTSLVFDLFVSNMKNATVQDRLFTEPMDNLDEAPNPDAPMKRIRLRTTPQQKQTSCVEAINIKDEPVLAFEKNDCYKCGGKTFVMGHQKLSRAKNVECRKCGKTGPHTRICRAKITGTMTNTTRNRKITVIRAQSRGAPLKTNVPTNWKSYK